MRIRHRLLVAASLGALSACGSSSVAPSAPTPVVGVTGGVTVYFDDFTDARSGWFSGQTAAGTSFTYGTNAYVISSHHGAVNFTAAHDDVHRAHIAIDVDAVVTTGNPATAGAGTWCFQDNGPPRAGVYMFLVFPDQHFEIRRYANVAAQGTVVQHGQSPLIKPVGQSNHIVAACRTLSNHGGTANNEVVLAVNGSVIADVFDTWKDRTASGWASGLLINGDDHVATTIEYKHFRIRDLGGA